MRSFPVQFQSDSLQFVHNQVRGSGTSALPKGWVLSPDMEPTMISSKVLGTAAAIALALPMAVPSASFAQNPNSGRYNAPPRAGTAPAAPRMGGAPSAQFRASGGAPSVQSGRPNVQSRVGAGYGGGYAGDGYARGYRHRDGDGRFIPGAVAGAVVGGALASQSYGYYAGPGYYGPDYDDQYYDDSAVAVGPAPGGGDDVGYCMQTYRSYDPASGTYLGYDGLRHPCP